MTQLIEACGNCSAVFTDECELCAPCPARPEVGPMGAAGRVSALSAAQHDEVRAIVASMIATVLNGASDRLADAISDAVSAQAASLQGDRR